MTRWTTVAVKPETRKRVRALADRLERRCNETSEMLVTAALEELDGPREMAAANRRQQQEK